MQIVIGNMLSAEEIKTVARHARARALHRRPGHRGLCRAHRQEQPASRGLRPLARDGPQARGRAGSRQRGLSAGGAAEGALAAPFSPLRAGHALRQPRRRRADGRHAHRHRVHALSVRSDELRWRRAHDRERRGAKMRSSSPAGTLVAYSATSLHRVTDVTRGARLAAVGWATELHPRPGATRTAVRSRHRAAADVRARRQVDGVRPRLEVVRQSAADVGRGLTSGGYACSSRTQLRPLSRVRGYLEGSAKKQR